MEYQVTISGEEFEKLKAKANGNQMVIMIYDYYYEPKEYRYKMTIETANEAAIILAKENERLLRDLQKLSDKVESLDRWIVENCTKRQINRFIRDF